MNSAEAFMYKIANQEWEFEAIHRLNYKTFVEEIPQHQPNQERRRIDIHHAENTYIICIRKDNQQLVGMIAFRDKRPFSLDQKLEKLDGYLPDDRKLCEVRLLAVEEEFRYSRIAQGLIARLVQLVIDSGCDLAVISGTVRQAKLYSHLGFTPFGPVIGSENAQYQPMYLTVEDYQKLQERSRALTRGTPELTNDDTILFNFLPGPVDFAKQVQAAYHQKPCSHRGDDFMRAFQQTRTLLCRLTNAGKVEIMMGSGTLANDAIAGQLSLLRKPGLILVSGEFGRRLVKNAKGAGLAFKTLEIPEGRAFAQAEIENVLNDNPDITWIWATHCETSTGVLNDLAMYKQICKERGLKLCLDAISSIGTVALDLENVYLASATSGKGLAAIAGLSMVFHHHSICPAPDDLPCVLDLGLYEQNNGIPFTIQSNLVYALLAALKTHDWAQRFATISDWSKSVRHRLAEMNAPILAPDHCATPAVITIVLPEPHSSVVVGDVLKEHGILVSYRSEYLLERNWIQVCMMGVETKSIEKFLRVLEKTLT